MKHFVAPLALAIAALSAPAFAQGDATKGEAEFKKCKACHAIIADDGTEIQKGGKTGPNLYGVIGRAVAGDENFGSYSESIKAVGAAGIVWDEASVAAFTKDPSAWLKEQTGDAAAKSKMTFKLAKGGEDVAAYLASVAPAPAE
jgi:cytochrome c